jgi:serine/arginine repetitive matrix protein 2
MSSYSSVHAWSTGNVTTRSARSGTLGLAKPLIDINALTGSKPSFTAAEKNTAGFTQGPTLLSGTRLSMSPSSLSTENPSDLNLPLTRKVPPMKFVSPPSSPPKEAMRLTPHTVDEVDNTTKSDPITLPSEKSASAEQPRDALTERLSRAINTKVIPSSIPSVSRAKNSVPAQTESPNTSAGDTSDSSCQFRSEKINFPSTKEVQTQPSAQRPSPAPTLGDRSPADESLAELLGTAGINFMFHNENPDQSSESESEEDEDSVIEGVEGKEVVKEESESEDEDSVVEGVKEEVASTGNGIAPIPIKERPPTSSFSVTSRPPFPGRDCVTAAQTDATRLSTASNVVAPRSRSITLTPSSSPLNKVSVYNDIRPVPSNVSSKSTSNNPSPKVRNDALKVPNVRQRSSTMVTGVPLNVPTAKAFHVPERPFAVRRNSPASSTEDSSSGRAPLTPRDGSEIDVQDRRRHEWSGGASGLGVKNQHHKRRSVNFEEDRNDSKLRGIPHSKGKQHTNSNAATNDEDREVRRKERRRGEAKAAIEVCLLSSDLISY